MNDYNEIRSFLAARMTQVEECYHRGDYAEGYKISLLIVEAIEFYHKYWAMDFSCLYDDLIAIQPVHQLILSISSRWLAQRGLHDAAVMLAATAAAKATGNALPLAHAAALRKAGELEGARAIARKLLAAQPNDSDARSELAECDVAELFWQEDYYDVMNRLHQLLKPGAYLEIGVAQGRSLALSRSQAESIGVDPDTGEAGRLFFHSPENTPQLFRVTSDDFFASNSLSRLFEQKTPDMVFLDGLHHFDQTLKDFINVERNARPDTVVLIHDCLPVNALVAQRDRQTSFWLGDVWKIIPCLKSIRPDLEIVTLPVRPSGLAVVRNLDPGSRVLERQFEAVSRHFNTLSLPETWEEKCRLCQVTGQSPEELFAVRG